MRILLVDSNPNFAEMLRVGLKAAGGHSVDTFATTAAALEAIGQPGYALALVEYAGEEGRAFLRDYRDRDPLLAVVVLTAWPTQASAVEFLRGGSASLAVDYIAKPEPNLIEKLSALIEQRFARITHGDWTLDRRQRQAYYCGEPVELTAAEYAMFTYFMQRPYEEVQHEDLWKAIKGETLDHFAAVTAVRAQIFRLRKKLADVAGHEVIQSQRLSGFRFRPARVGEAAAEIPSLDEDEELAGDNAIG